MKRFISVSLILVGVSLIATVIVWYLLQGMFIKDDEKAENNTNVWSSLIGGRFEQKESALTETNNDETNEEPITIGNFTVTKEQQHAAESIGLDLSAIELTEEVINCARETLSQERLDAILSGLTPTFLETLSLLPCLKN